MDSTCRSRVSPGRSVVTAVTWLTVLPLPHRDTGPVDRGLGGAVMAAVPVVGALLGAVAAAVGWGLSYTRLPDLLIGVLLVAGLALFTRGMHVDGLADTVDGLGCYGPPERVTEVMRSGGVGPFGAAAVIALMIVDTVGFAALVDRSEWWSLGLAVVVGRVAAVLAAARPAVPAHTDGFGALVIGTQRTSAVVWAVVVVVAAACTGFTVDAKGFDTVVAVRGVLVVVVIGAMTLLLRRHCARRMGGLSGDVLGAAIEAMTAVAVVGFLL